MWPLMCARLTYIRVARKVDAMNKPYTLNVIYRDGEVSVDTYDSSKEALAVAKEEAKWESTVHVELVYEPSGDILFEADGEFV